MHVYLHDLTTCSTPKGLEDVSKYPFLFAELIRRGYTDDDVEKIARKNFMRVFQAVEKVPPSIYTKSILYNIVILFLISITIVIIIK